MIKKGKNMNLIKLESVGTAVDKEGNCHPINSDGTLDMSDGMGPYSVNIFECSDEWYWTLSLVDGYKLLSFLDENIGWYEGSQIHGGYEEWKEKVKGLMGQPDTLVEVV